MTNGKLFEDVGLPPIDPQSDRFMLCGSPHMLADIRAILKDKGFIEGNHGAPAHYVIEKAFVEG
jgi:ferredoxin--NADP+ reductase